MKFSFMNQLLALLCIMLIGGARIAFAQDDNSTAVKVNAPTITPSDCEYNGTIMPIITADEGCSIVYVKSTSKLYTTTEAIDSNKGVKTESSNKATITDIINKTGDRYISAYAVKEVNGTKYKSPVTTATYTYNKDAATKENITLSATSLSFSSPTAKAQNLSISAKDKDSKDVSGLTYSYEVYPEGIVTIDDASGLVTPKKAGTASITINFEGNDKYNAATCVVDVNVSSTATSSDKVFYSIADIRHATQSITTGAYKDNKKNTGCALIFTKDNPATVIAIMRKSDPDIEDKNFINSFFIIDNSNRGLMITPSKLFATKGNKNQNDVDYWKLAVGSKIIGTIVGTYTEGISKIPALTEIATETTVNNVTYTTQLTVDHSDEAKDDDDIPATYPYTEIQDVNTIAKTNKTVTNGDIVASSYGVYLNTIVKVPGTIRTTIGKEGREFYLMQNDTTKTSEVEHRIYFNCSQLEGIHLLDYVGTSGIFEGILIKRIQAEPKLVVLKNDFYTISKIYLDENDPEDRITDLVNNGSFDDEVDIYVHRPKLVNTNGAWNTLCFPFDLTADEFEKAFGCKLTALAAPSQKGNTTVNGRATIIGDVDANGNLLFEPKSDHLQIEAGMPYLMKASGTQTAGHTPDGFSYTNTNGTYIDDKNNIKTPTDIETETKGFYAHIGQKFITVVPPHQIEGEYNNNVVNGKFYFRGLYGRKDSTEDRTANLYDNGSEKYQYISTGEGNYLKYLTSDNQKLKFPGMRAYFYFPYWNAANNNKQQTSGNTTNSKIHIFVDGSTTGIHDIESTEGTKTANDGRIYNLAGQVVDSSYKGIVIKNGRKYLAK